MNDMPPPRDYDLSSEPPPYPDDWYDYLPEAEPFLSPPSDLDAFIPDDYTPQDKGIPDLPSAEQDGLQGFEEIEPDDEAWSWYDTRLIGVDHGADVTDGRYEIGGIDVYANHETGDLGGSYLPVASFDDLDEAEATFHELQRQMHEEAVPVYELVDYLQQQAFIYHPEPQNWRGAEPVEYAAYEHARGLDELDSALDLPPDETLDSLIETAIELGGVARELESQFTEEQQALAEIGLQAESFDPAHNPPPFYDEQTDTSYWIGVFQADAEDREHCVTSILSLGRDEDSGELVAHLAPCVPGDWDKTYSAAEYLIDVAQRGGIEQVFDTAEGMALATDQRGLWQTPLGVPLEPDTAQGIADIAQDSWELDR